MTKYYTYLLINSIDNQPFYVGKGAGSRMYQHLKESQRADYIKRSVHYKILSILKQTGKILYERIDQSDEINAFNLEKELIAKYGRKDNGTGMLCNLTDGGDTGSRMSPESVEKRAAKHRGMKRSKKSRQRMKEAQLLNAKRNRELYGTGCSPEAIKHMSEARKGKPWSENACNVKRNKPTAKPILVYKKNTNEFVGEWESISLCAKQLHCTISAIWKICEGVWMSKAPNGKMYPYKTHKGYIFRYK